MFRFSASQIKLFRACQRKWWFEYCQGKRSDPGAGAALGTEIHSQLENWLRKKTVPSHEAAVALLPLLPHPHEKMRIEHEFSLLTKSGIARGFIDLLLPHAEGIVRPEHLATHSEKLPHVFDHKTTSGIHYALTEKDLETDPQAILYGLEARKFAGTTDDVICAWNYTQTKGKRAVKPVVIRQTQGMFEDGFLTILDDAALMGKIQSSGCVERDVGFDTDECESYGGCPHRSTCQAYTLRVVGSVEKKSAWEKLDATAEGEYTAPAENNMGFLEELAKKANAPFTPAAAAVTTAPVEVVAPAPPPNVTPEPTEMPPIEVVATAPSSVLPPEVAKPKKSKKKDGETLSVEALVRQALTAAVETDNLHAMSILSGLLRDLNSPRS